MERSGSVMIMGLVVVIRGTGVSMGVRMRSGKIRQADQGLVGGLGVCLIEESGRGLVRGQMRLEAFPITKGYWNEVTREKM